MIEFRLDDEQREKLNAWMLEVDPPDKDDLTLPKHAAIGGAYTFCFTPTSLGTSVKVIYTRGTQGEKTIDLTDYASW